MHVTAHETLAGALDLGRRELVAMVGGGGKTSALRLLAQELTAKGGRVVATTTTAMFRRELAQIGPVVMDTSLPVLLAGLRKALAERGSAGAAYAPGADGKVVGLSVDWVDELWADDLADYLIVEADGSRGRSLKAFGAHEPQVPAATTTVVQVAGLDALGAPLTEEHVHRAGLFSAALQAPLGSAITASVFANGLREQLRVLRERWPEARIVTMLNKADGPDKQVVGIDLAAELLARPGQNYDRPIRDQGPDRSPDAVIVAGLRGRRFVRVCREVSVSAVVLAAGLATRMGEQKVLLPLGGRSLVQWVVDAALGSRAVETIVVVGREAGPVHEALEDRPVTVVVNPDHALGMSTSLQAGVRAVGPGCDAVIFLLADQPFVTPALVDRLIDRFAETRKWVIRPLVGDRLAHPVLMSAALFPEILDQRGDVGGREIAQRHPERLSLVPMDDSRLDLDIDTGEDYETALRMDGRLVERTRESQ